MSFSRGGGSSVFFISEISLQYCAKMNKTDFTSCSFFFKICLQNSQCITSSTLYWMPTYQMQLRLFSQLPRSKFSSFISVSLSHHWDCVNQSSAFIPSLRRVFVSRFSACGSHCLTINLIYLASLTHWHSFCSLKNCFPVHITDFIQFSTLASLIGIVTNNIFTTTNQLSLDSNLIILLSDLVCLAFLVLQQIQIIKLLFLVLNCLLLLFLSFHQVITCMNIMVSYSVGLHLDQCCPVEISKVMGMLYIWALQQGNHQSHMAGEHQKCG